MVVKIEIPEWAIGRHIYIFAGRELLGKCLANVSHEDGKHKTRYGPLLMKPDDGRCNGCGNCCGTASIPEAIYNAMKKHLEKPYDKNRCVLLSESGCVMGGHVPFGCVKSVCTDYEGCTERVE